MSAKCLLALVLVAALVALASPYYINEDLDDEEEGGAVEELEAQALPLYLQKRGRGMRFIGCFDDSGSPCKCDRSRGRSRQCKK